VKAAWEINLGTIRNTIIMNRIFISGDHKMFIEGISNMLNSSNEFTVIGYAFSAEEFFENSKHHAFDILILVFLLPIIKGIEIAKKIRKEQPELKIIILSKVYSPSLIVQLKKLKVNGFLTKNKGFEELVDCLREVSNNKTYFPEHNLSKQKAINQNTQNLTKREIEIVQQISNGHTSQQISVNLFISLSTVETHRKNIIQKLGTKNVAELIRFATREGIL
jgi:DNA-binding NarL/FixJ family response regulator